MNKVIFTGNLVKDAELRVLKDEKSVCNFRIAVIDRRAPKEKTLFIDAALFGGTRPEKLVKFLTKGKRIMIEGNLAIQEGEKRTFIKVYVRELEFLDRKGPDQPIVSGAPEIPEEAF
jgi:single stranded DNA-binding protein